jgi:tetratricopeptide (TPR) repeat protein
MKWRALLFSIAALCAAGSAQAQSPTYVPEPKAESLLVQSQQATPAKRAKLLGRARRELAFSAQHKPTNVPTWEFLSLVTYYQQDYESFVQCQHRLHELGHPDSRGFWTAAEWSFGREDYVSALEFIDFAVQAEGPSMNAVSSRRNVYMRLYQGDSALHTVAQWVADNPSDAAAALLYAQTLAELGGEEEAYMAYRHILNNFPDVVDARWQFLRWAAGAGRWDEALAAAQGIWSDPGITERAKVAYATSFLEEDPQNAAVASLAVRWTEGLLAQDSVNPAFWALRGDIARWLGDLATAESSWRTCLSLPGGTEWPVFQQLLQLDLETNHTDNLYRDALAAESAHPQHPFGRLFVGVAQMRAGDHAAAYATLSEGQARTAGDPEVSEQYALYLGEVAYRLGKNEEFRAHFDRALSLNPQNPTTLNNYAYFLALGGTELRRAESLALQAVQLADGEASFWDTLAAVYEAQRKFPKAKDAIQRALDSGGLESATIVERAGDIYAALGAHGEARRLYKHAQSLGNTSSDLARKLNQLPTL